MKKIALLLCLLLLLPAAACGGKAASAPPPTEAHTSAPTAAPDPTPTPTPEPTPAPTPEPTPAPTPEPTPVPTPTPAPTPEPTPAPTPEPTPEPTPSGSSHKGESSEKDTPTGPAWLTLPEGAHWLTHRELAIWGAWFDGEFIREQFLYSTYARPEEVDLCQLFYNGPGRETPPADLTDIRAFLMKYGTWNTWTDVMKLPAETADDVLKEYTGLEVRQTAGVGRYMLSYVPETDCYYMFRGDTNRQGAPVFLYGWEKDEVVSLFYEGFTFGHDRSLQGIYRVTLRLTPGDWRFVSNEFCQVEQGRLTYVAEPDDWNPEEGEENTGWLLPEADETLSADSLTAAVDRVRGRYRNREEYALSFGYTGGSPEPFYVFIIGACEDGSTEAYFLGGDGTVVPLPVPSHIPPDEVFYDANSTLLCQFSCGEETEDGYRGRSWTFLVPTGELFWRDYSW